MLENNAQEKRPTLSYWDSGAVILWFILLLLGLFSEASYEALREWGHVVTQRAIINSSWFITLACAAYFGWFAYQRCRESGDQDTFALGKSVQIAVLALAAFLPLPVEQFPLFLLIPIALYRRLIIAVVFIKMAAWIYLLSIILRYYFLSGPAVFKNMRQIFTEGPPPSPPPHCASADTPDLVDAPLDNPESDNTPIL